MKLTDISILAALVVASGSAAAETAVYDCKVQHSARVTGGHPETDRAMIGTADDPDREFAIEITSPEHVASCDKACKLKQAIREVPPARKRKTVLELCESGGNQVLMHPYSAKSMQSEYSVDFRSARDLGFLRLVGPFDHGQSYLFWQSGFEYPGCEDTHLVIRKGECIRRD